jgi:flavorubredoxin
MKTYLVRTIEDQVLIGVFCEKSKKALIETISPLIEAQDCEYIVMNRPPAKAGGFRGRA